MLIDPPPAGELSLHAEPTEVLALAFVIRHPWWPIGWSEGARPSMGRWCTKLWERVLKAAHTVHTIYSWVKLEPAATGQVVITEPIRLFREEPEHVCHSTGSSFFDLEADHVLQHPGNLLWALGPNHGLKLSQSLLQLLGPPLQLLHGGRPFFVFFATGEPKALVRGLLSLFGSGWVVPHQSLWSFLSGQHCLLRSFLLCCLQGPSALVHLLVPICFVPLLPGCYFSRNPFNLFTWRCWRWQFGCGFVVHLFY